MHRECEEGEGTKRSGRGVSFLLLFVGIVVEAAGIAILVGESDEAFGYLREATSGCFCESFGQFYESSGHFYESSGHFYKALGHLCEASAAAVFAAELPLATEGAV